MMKMETNIANILGGENLMGATHVNPTLRVSDSSLAVEHRIYFNEYYRQKYERNKVIIAKNDKRKKGLLFDKEMSTEFEKSVVYEAYDSIFAEDSFNVTS